MPSHTAYGGLGVLNPLCTKREVAGRCVESVGGVWQPKPSHLSGDYGAWFKDPLLVAAYPARPEYPSRVIESLIQLVENAPRMVLAVGCGTGELARRLC
jgi:hypothetical protein